MQPRARTVLHVLPHPGGGGERYVDLLGDMPDHRFDRVYLGSSAGPAPVELVQGMARVLRRARGYDLLHVHGEAAAGFCLPLLVTRPSVVTLHGLHLVRRLKGVRRRAAVHNLRAVLRTADRAICVSRTEHDELVRIAETDAARRALVIRNGVHVPPPPSEAERAAVRRQLGIPGDEVVGIWVGSLDERKDPLTAVRAANSADVLLLVVGTGPLAPELERAAGSRVRALGQRADVARLLAAADFYVLTSHREGLSLSLLEAMASGLAPIVTDLPENTEAVADTGIVVPPGDGTALASAFARLRSDESERLALGARARERVTSCFRVEGMVRRTRDVYDDVAPAGVDHPGPTGG